MEPGVLLLHVQGVSPGQPSMTTEQGDTSQGHVAQKAKPIPKPKWTHGASVYLQDACVNSTLEHGTVPAIKPMPDKTIPVFSEPLCLSNISKQQECLSKIHLTQETESRAKAQEAACLGTY